MSIRVAELPSTKGCILGRDRGYFPVVATVTGRDVLLVWRAGAGHMGIAGRLEAVRSDDGVNWSEPVVIADSAQDDRNPAVGVTGGAGAPAVVVAYHVNGCYGPGDREYDPKLGRLATRLVRSRDGGRTWEAPYPLTPPEFDGLSPYGQMLALPDGRLLMPIYGSLSWRSGAEEHSSSFLLQSADGGLTWALRERAGENVNESAFLPLSGGVMLGVVRSDVKDSRLLTVLGDGRGRWSPPADLTSGHEHPACLTQLGDGAVLLCYGHRRKPFGTRGLLSRDEGATWLRDREIVFSDSADNWDCGYPSTVRLTDGRLATAWYSTAGEGDGWSCKGAYCHVLVWREEELLNALQG